MLALTAFASAGAVASTSAPNLPPLTGVLAGKFLVIGDVAHPALLDVPALAALPAHTETVTFKAGNGSQTHTYVGPLLVDVLTQAGPQFDPTIKNDKLRHYVSVSATDGYRVLVAYGEIDPGFENKEVLLATSEDGHSLATDGPRRSCPATSAAGAMSATSIGGFFEKPPL